MDKLLYLPTEVLTFKKLDKLLVLPFGKMVRPKIPFRFKGKWYRRTSKNTNQCNEIKMIFEMGDKNLVLCDKHDISTFSYAWKYKETIFSDDLIAVFKEFLTDWEQKFAVSTLKLYEPKNRR